MSTKNGKYEKIIKISFSEKNFLLFFTPSRHDCLFPLTSWWSWWQTRRVPSPRLTSLSQTFRLRPRFNVVRPLLRRSGPGVPRQSVPLGLSTHQCRGSFCPRTRTGVIKSCWVFRSVSFVTPKKSRVGDLGTPSLVVVVSPEVRFFQGAQEPSEDLVQRRCPQFRKKVSELFVGNLEMIIILPVQITPYE